MVRRILTQEKPHDTIRAAFDCTQIAPQSAHDRTGLWSVDCARGAYYLQFVVYYSVQLGDCDHEPPGACDPNADSGRRDDPCDRHGWYRHLCWLGYGPDWNTYLSDF